MSHAFFGKEVHTAEAFDYATAKPGGYVAHDVIDNSVDCLPPAYMTNSLLQIGEPYSYRLDANKGKLRPTYATFKRVTVGPDGIWKYCGHCFRGEAVERGYGPVYASETEKRRMEYPELIEPKKGMVYRNRCGSDFLCKSNYGSIGSHMIRITDGWSCIAKGIRQYGDGTIEWDHSTDGHWQR